LLSFPSHYVIYIIYNLNGFWKIVIKSKDSNILYL
jgi:hypothetical protein